MPEKLGYIAAMLFVITSIIGSLNWSKLPNYKSKVFLFSIMFSSIVEVIGIFFNEWTNGLLSYYVYNVYIYVLFVIYLFILRSILKNYRCKVLGTFFIILYTCGFILNLILQFDTLGHNIYSGVYSLGVLLFIILSSFYLIELFNSSNVLNYKKNIFFWFIIGVLLFHVPFLPFMLALDWFLIEYRTSTYWIVLLILNLIMNTCFIIGFLWTEKKYNY